jgi:hypothetical protein
MRRRPSPWLVWIPLSLAVVLGAVWFTAVQYAGASETPPLAEASGPELLAAELGVDRLDSSQRQPIPLSFDAPIPIRVYASPTCGCCSLWMDHLRMNGFEVETVHRMDMAEIKAELGVRPQLSSCHTGVVNGYIVEGHVPAEDIRTFLAEAPQDALGLTVPGMPIGSPGMEVGGRVDPYDVLVFFQSGTTQVLRSYGGS